MSPLFKSGDYAVLLTWPILIPKSGAAIVFEHYVYGTILKSVTDIKQNESTFSAKGLSPSSVDQESLKNMPFSCIKGRVIWMVSAPLSHHSTPKR